MTELMQIDIRWHVIKLCEKFGGLRSASRKLGIDAGYLSRIRDRKKNPSDNALKSLGLIRHTYYTIDYSPDVFEKIFKSTGTTDDCDSGVEGIPDGCVIFRCNEAPLEERNGLVICTSCGCSYGPTPVEQAND